MSLSNAIKFRPPASVQTRNSAWQLWKRNAAYLAALTVAAPWLIYRCCRNPRYRAGLQQKLLGPSTGSQVIRSDAANISRVWLHGVSVGEIQLLASLQQHLARELPQAEFVISTTTASGMALLEKLLPSLERFYFPFDFSWAVRSALSVAKPDLVVLGELELWPNFIDLVRKNHIPIVVVNGRLSEKSFTGYRRFHSWTQTMFENLNYVLAQSETYAERFRQCGCTPERVRVTGNMKFDNLAFSTNAPQVEYLRRLIGLQTQHRVVVVGSSQEPEEQAAVQAFADLRCQFPDCRLIIVPRHPDRFEDVYHKLCRGNLRCMRRSCIAEVISAANWEVLLVDTVGELRWWWGLAELALVGGSFANRGGQNMLEPAAYGADVAFGPNTANFRDITGLLLENDAARRLDSTHEIRAWIQHGLLHPAAGKLRGERARQLVASQQGATQRTVAVLAQLLSEKRRAA